MSLTQIYTKAQVDTLLALKQTLDATLTALAGASTAANKLAYFSGVDVVSLTDFSAAGRALIDDADAAAQRTTLGLGTGALLVTDTDGTLAANSDANVATQKAIKSAIATALASALAGVGAPIEFEYALSDESTELTTGLKITTYASRAFTLVEVFAGLTAQSTSGTPTFDVKVNGTSVFTTKVSIDINEDTSHTATSGMSILHPNIAKYDKIEIYIDVAGTGAKGAKIALIGTRA
jgi:hypothetical protein